MRNNNQYYINTKDIRNTMNKEFDNLGRMGKFLEIYNIPKLNQVEAES